MAAEATPTAAEPELTEAIAPYRRRKRLINDKENLPEDIPVEVIEHSLHQEEQICPECGEVLHPIGQETTREELVTIPAHLVVRKHVCIAYGCRSCDRTGIKTPILKSSSPAPVIKGSFASPESVAHVMCEKFVIGTPLYRQEQYWNRKGIMLSRQTMSNWVITATESWLIPIYDALKKALLSHNILHADETVLQVLHEKDKPPQSNSYMWLYRTSGDAQYPIVLYDYRPDRRAKRPAEFLSGFKGFLHTDGYEGYHSLPPDIKVIGSALFASRKAAQETPQKPGVSKTRVPPSCVCLLGTRPAQI